MDSVHRIFPEGKHLEAYLQRDTHSVQIYLLSPYFCPNVLAELLAIFQWIAEHVEISSILLSSRSEFFGLGLHPEITSKMEQKNLLHFLAKTKKLIYSFFFLPQTIIVDYKAGATGLSFELGIGADIRLCQEQAQLQMNHLQQGQLPCCGGIGLLQEIVPHSFARSWVLSGQNIPMEQLTSSGLIYHTYSAGEDGGKNLLQLIQQQAPVQRIQTKRGLLEHALERMEKNMQSETSITNPGIITGDWKEYYQARSQERTPHFTSARSFSGLVKKIKEQKLQA